MYTVTKEIRLHKTISFSEDEVKKLVEKYKEDAKFWYERYYKNNMSFDDYIKDADTFNEFIQENYFWNLDDFYIDSSDSDLYNFYNEVEKFL